MCGAHPTSASTAKPVRSEREKCGHASTSLRYAQHERGWLARFFSVRPEPFDRLRTGYTAAGGEVEGRPPAHSFNVDTTLRSTGC